MQKNCIEFEEKGTKDAKGKKVKRKQTVLRTRKSIGQGRSAESDDDFKPIKAPAAAKRKAGALTGETKKKSSYKGKEKENDEDLEAKPVPENNTAVKRKATIPSKKNVLEDDDDEEEEVSAPAKKRSGPQQATTSREAPPKRKVSRQRKMTVLDEESDEDEYEILRVKKQAVKVETDSEIEIVERVKGKAKRKR